MDIYTERKKRIREILTIAIKTGKFENFILMMPAYCIESRDLNGFVKPNRYFTMEAIYEYYRENPLSRIDELMYNTLISVATKYKGEEAVLTVLETVQYQLVAEKRKTVPFIIDCQFVLNKLKITLLKNKEMYMQPKQAFDYVPFWNTIEEYDSKFQKEYGHRVL